MLNGMRIGCTCESDPDGRCAVHPMRGVKVLVWPHGDAAQAAVGTVVMISRNERSIAVSFDNLPSFANTKGGIAIHPTHGIIFLAVRESVGPWVELFGNGHYEIEVRDKP